MTGSPPGRFAVRERLVVGARAGERLVVGARAGVGQVVEAERR